MKFIADFHIHSHYSMATSKNLVPEYLEYWARLKGINVLGTGDCVHPGWLKELKEKLVPAGNGLYTLKAEHKLEASKYLSHKKIPDEVYFILTGEISSIYKKNEKVRKVHNLCVFPDFASVEAMQDKLEKIGNIRSDGRPILGLDSKILLDMLLHTSQDAYLIPAHIWTPWFSVLGSKSGFNSIEECYEDLTPHIFAVETGLSSDPPMNWACSFLDRFKLVSNSDAHSPEKLGREANLFDTEISYNGIYSALKNDKGYIGTIEFHPQEGKYHYDGHRKCEICWDPLQTIEHNGICPVCGKAVTKGVMYRVAELADRDVTTIDHKNTFYSITQLPDLLAEIYNQKNSKSKTVQKNFMTLIENIGSEFHVLLDASLNEIETIAGELVAEGIRRLRENKIIIEDGYDGEFGRIKVFNQNEIADFSGRGLFSSPVEQAKTTGTHGLSVKFDINQFKSLLHAQKELAFTDKKDAQDKPLPKAEPEKNFSDEQLRGIRHYTGPCMILAGPGSGKTRILTERMRYLVCEHNIQPENILALTFSNKAAAEIRARLKDSELIHATTITTFHAFGLAILKKYYLLTGRNTGFFLVDEDQKIAIIKELVVNKKEAKIIAAAIDSLKQGLEQTYEGKEDVASLFSLYNTTLANHNSFDLSDLIYQPVELFKNHRGIATAYQQQYSWILIDEFQDINARQYELIQSLTNYADPNLFVIGDPDQAIYGFRGSDVRFINNLATDYPGLETIELSQSFRCPDNIMKIAAQVLQKPHAVQGTSTNIKTHIEEMATDKSEADWIAATIEKLMGGVRSFSIDSGITDGESASENISFKDFAILCRSAFMFGPLIKACNDHGIPCQVINTDNFFTQEPLNSAIKLIKKVYYNPAIHDKTEDDWKQEIATMLAANQPLTEILSALLPGIDEDTRKKITIHTRSFHHDYPGFFEHVMLRRGADDNREDAESVSIMTMHASKGLEFNTVFVAGCEDGIIPFTLFNDKNPGELQEEERLFYVAITRTRHNLYLCHAKKRMYNNRLLEQHMSPFLKRLQLELLESHKRETVKKHTNKDKDQQLDLF